MKKFILFILITILVTSCVPMPTPSENDKVNNAEKSICYYKINGKLKAKYVIKFEYDGHKYIQFGYRDRQIVHNPDCDCHNRQQTKTETIIIEKEKKVENNNNNYDDLFNF